MTNVNDFSQQSDNTRDVRFVTILVLFLLFVYLAVGLALRHPLFSSKVPVAGDEHHYLTQSVSLLEDGDLVVVDDYEDAKYLEYYGAELDPSLWNLIGEAGFSGHSPGPGVVVAPGWWLAGWPAVMATTAAAMAASFAVTAVAFQRVAPPHRSRQGVVLIAVGYLSLPLFAYSHTLYPETFMAAIVAGIVLCAVVDWHSLDSRGRTVTGIVGISLAGVSLAMHPKYVAVLACTTVYFIGATIWRDRGRPKTLFCTLLYVITATTWGLLFSWIHMVMWGDFSPFGWWLGVRDALGVGLPRAFAQLLDQLFGLQIGLFTLVPLTLLSIPFMIWSFSDTRPPVDRAIVCLILLLGASILIPASLSDAWFAGDVPLARYATPVVPLLLLAAAIAVSRVSSSPMRLGILVLFASVGLAQTLAYTSYPISFRPRPDGGGGIVGILAGSGGGIPLLDWIWTASMPGPWWPTAVGWTALIGLSLWAFGRSDSPGVTNGVSTAMSRP